LRIAVVDYGMGNLRSVSKALEHVAPEAEVLVTDDAAAIRAAARVVVPGQGAMPDCMRELAARGLVEPVFEASRNKPFLGICIGLQMLFDRSEEGDVRGLGVLAGAVRRFAEELRDPDSGARLKVPHMGWNGVAIERTAPPLRGIASGEHFYFVHSYYVAPNDMSVTATVTDYGMPFVSSIWRDNVFACQFHPEKSQAAGLRVVKNFGEWRA